MVYHEQKERRQGSFRCLPAFSRHLLGFACAASTVFTHGSCQFYPFGSPPAPDPFDILFKSFDSTMNAAVIASIFISIAVVAIAGIAVFYCLYIVDTRTRHGDFTLPYIQIGSKMPPEGVSFLPIEMSGRLRKLQFTYAEVLEITSNLRIKLGEGGFGPVYYGKLKDGSAVAVKKLSSTSLQGTDEFLNEVGILSRAHHKNLVSLVGYCCEENERCLIYEFMPKGTLDDRLHGLPSEQEPLKWLIRLRIAIGAAKGFSYLHNDCSPAIIHRDVKCSNILLDDSLSAKVSDFGLSKLLTQSALTHITTGVKGTFGYLDPEYAETERLTEKSDVYSFGVMLLELLTGNKPIMQHDGEYVHIAQWAKPYITTRTLANILDKKLGDIKNKEPVEAVANIALQCVAYRSSERPLFQEVLQVLEEAALQVELSQQTILPLAAADFSIDPHTGVHTAIPIIGGSNSRDESIVHVAHKTT